MPEKKNDFMNPDLGKPFPKFLQELAQRGCESLRINRGDIEVTIPVAPEVARFWERYFEETKHQQKATADVIKTLFPETLSHLISKVTANAIRHESQLIEVQLKAIADIEGLTPEQINRRYVVDHNPIKGITRILRVRASKGKPKFSQVGYAIQARWNPETTDFEIKLIAED